AGGRDSRLVRAGRVHLSHRLGMGRRRRCRADVAGPARTSARGGHRAPRRARAARRRRPRHRHDQGQAPDGHRTEGPTGDRVVTLPRLVVAAPSTGQGKTTIATGLMGALRARGLTVSGHKVGPDYIDPGYHSIATGRPGRNLDPHLVGEELVMPLLRHGARGADIAVIEGVMGLHDGRLGTDGYASTAHVARLTRSPVVLVVDIARVSRSIGAVVAGMAAYDPSIDVVGVILNRAGSARNVAEVERSVRLPVLGVVPRDDSLSSPSRHLGLVPAAERDGVGHLVERLSDHVAAHVDLEAILQVARAAPDLDVDPWDPAAQVR